MTTETVVRQTVYVGEFQGYRCDRCAKIDSDTSPGAVRYDHLPRGWFTVRDVYLRRGDFHLCPECGARALEKA